MLRSILLRSRNPLSELCGVKNITRASNYPIIATRSSQTSANHMIETESPFKNDGSWFKQIFSKVGMGEANIFALRKATIFHYEACTDKLDPALFFEHFKLPDTLFSFYLITQLHVWMCQTRSMSEGKEGRILRNEVVERMWQDFDVRLSKIEVYQGSKRKTILEDLLFHHQCAMLSYDEGLLTDDKTLASALWRTLYSKSDVEPHLIESAVKYVRTQMTHLRSLGPREWCLDGRFEWATYPPVIVGKAP